MKAYSMPFRFFKGFRSWLKNPEERKDAAAYFASLHALEVPDDISANEIRKMVTAIASNHPTVLQAA